MKRIITGLLWNINNLIIPRSFELAGKYKVVATVVWVFHNKPFWCKLLRLRLQSLPAQPCDIRPADDIDYRNKFRFLDIYVKGRLTGFHVTIHTPWQTCLYTVILVTIFWYTLCMQTCSELERDVPGFVTHFKKQRSLAFWVKTFVIHWQIWKRTATYIHKLLCIGERNFLSNRVHHSIFLGSHIYKRKDV